MTGPLTGDVAVLSPHLDDAVFSLGAAIAAATRAGGAIRVVTVFAGDPESTAAAEWWDRKAGFATEGEAARERRAEDGRACEILSASPAWLPFSDASYGREIDDAALWEAVAQAIAGADTVLVPGFPLMHADHLRLARLVLERGVPSARLGLYVEQPYAKWQGRRRLSHRPSAPDEIASLLGGPVAWTSVDAAVRDRRTKQRAARAYLSQLPLFGRIRTPLLGRLLLRRVAVYEALRGGEAIGWLPEGTPGE